MPVVAKFNNEAGWSGQWDIGDGFGEIMTNVQGGELDGIRRGGKNRFPLFGRIFRLGWIRIDYIQNSKHVNIIFCAGQSANPFARANDC
jgi:hypothetical protein